MQQISGTFTPIAFMVMGRIDNNVYIIDDGQGCFVVDPACDAEAIVRAAGDRAIDAIVVTHAHWDHVGALAQLRALTGAPVIASAVEAPYVAGEKSFAGHSVESEPCPVDRAVEEGEVVRMGSTDWRVISTPGHTPGGMCLFGQPSEGQDGAPVLVSGDTLFAGTHGRVDFDEGDIDDMRESLAKLAALPHETVVLPGHGALTTIARESGWLRLCCL